METLAPGSLAETFFIGTGYKATYLHGVLFLSTGMQLQKRPLDGDMSHKNATCGPVLLRFHTVYGP